MSYSVELLGNPVVGVVLGLVCAAGFFWVSRSSFKMMRPDDAPTGLALVAVSLFARLLVATALLWAYKHIAPSGFKPFALTFAGGFLVMYTIEVVRYAGLQKHRRPAGTRQ